MKKIFFVFLVGLISSGVIAQKKQIGEYQNSDEKVNPDSFDKELFNGLLLTEINNLLDSVGIEGFQSDKFLRDVAEDHAREMALEKTATLDGPGKLETVSERLQAHSGSGVGDEIVMRFSIKEGEKLYTYRELSRNVVSKWASSTKSYAKLQEGKYYIMGLGSELDDSRKKVYVSCMLGNYYSKNQGADQVESLAVPITTKKYGLKGYEYRPCRKCKKYFPDLIDLQKGLSVNEDNEIVLEFNDLKRFKRLIRGKRDGLAVDIVQKAQYGDCKNSNIVNYELVNRGVMTKRLWAKKIYKKNLAPAEGKKNRVSRLKVVLGELPDGLNPEDVELNLMVIQDKSVCHNLTKSFVIDAGYEYSQKIDLLPDTIVPKGVPSYVPVATTNEFSFRVPFEKNKFEFNIEDITPIIETLNEPDFIINKIHIAAYSSIEGSVKVNQELQQQRSESIVKVLQENQNQQMLDSVSLAANWDDFKNDVKGTEFEEMSKMTMEQAIQHIRTKGLEKKLEPILQKHRYADVKIWITYDIEGEKEQMFVIDQFNKAIKAKDLAGALRIQKFMLEEVAKGKYDKRSVDQMEIPKGTDYTGLNMNKLCMKRLAYDDVIDEEYREHINHLASLDPENPYIFHNRIYCGVLLTDLTDEYDRKELQDEIDYMYDFELSKKRIDLLNIELQYRLMDEFKDSVGYDHPIVVKSMERIKEIIVFDEVNWQNSLKLASVFLNHGDYEYAFQLLDPFINEENIFPELLFTYISLCSKVDNKYHSNRFVMALEKARQIDPDRFCQMFKGRDAFPKQVFANDMVKLMHCQECSN